MSELISTSSAYIINGDSPMTSVANTVAMTTLAVHTLQPHIFYRLWAHRDSPCQWDPTRRVLKFPLHLSTLRCKPIYYKTLS